MIAMIGSVIGFLGSFAPRLFDFFERRQRHAQEVAMMRISAELQREQQTSRLEEIQLSSMATHNIAVLKHDSRLNHPRMPVWVDCVRALVRPALTFGVLVLYAVLLLTPQIHELSKAAFLGLEGMVSAVWSFWFGSRLVNNRGEK